MPPPNCGVIVLICNYLIVALGESEKLKYYWR